MSNILPRHFDPQVTGSFAARLRVILCVDGGVGVEVLVTILTERILSVERFWMPSCEDLGACWPKASGQGGREALMFVQVLGNLPTRLPACQFRWSQLPGYLLRPKQ